jgi:hypothetical protein
MDISKLTVSELQEISAAVNPTGAASHVDIPAALSFSATYEADKKIIGRYCCIRTYAAGVHVGTVDHIIRYVGGVDVIMSNVRRIWKWSGAFTLSEVTQEGIKPSGSRMSMITPWQMINNVVEIIPVTDKAKATFDRTTNTGD